VTDTGACPFGDEYRQRKWKEICCFTPSEIQMKGVSYHLHHVTHPKRTLSVSRQFVSYLLAAKRYCYKVKCLEVLRIASPSDACNHSTKMGICNVGSNTDVTACSLKYLTSPTYQTITTQITTYLLLGSAAL
jgi:hypothetical protein